MLLVRYLGSSIISNLYERHYDGKVNIVAHSKGGLDARWYISHSGSTTGKVEKLVMLGTPNQGTNAAWQDLTSCSIQGSSGLWDLMPGSDAIKSVDNPATHYYTIAGNYSVPCLFVLGFMYTCWALQNDGWVTVTSALSHYKSLGIYPYAHNDLLTHRDVYEKVLRELTRLSNH